MGRAERPRVAVLLPLGGDTAGLAQSMRQAVEPAGGKDAAPLEVQIIDSALGPAAIGADVRLILGPVFARDVPAVVAAAGGIPVLTFSNDSDLIGGGAFVFGVTPAQSIGAIFAYARAQGVRRVAVVVWDRPWGRQSAAAAAALAPRAGLSLQPVVTLRESGESAQLSRRLARDGAPDAVLLADGGAHLTLLAAALGGSALQLLGTSQWSGMDLAGAPALDGAWFAAPDPGPLDAMSPAPDRRSGLLPALARDGVTVAAALAKGGGAWRGGLLRSDGFATSLGRVRFFADGSVERDQSIFAVSASGVKLLVRAPS